MPQDRRDDWGNIRAHSGAVAVGASSTSSKQCGEHCKRRGGARGGRTRSGIPGNNARGRFRRGGGQGRTSPARQAPSTTRLHHPLQHHPWRDHQHITDHSRPPAGHRSRLHTLLTHQSLSSPLLAPDCHRLTLKSLYFEHGRLTAARLTAPHQSRIFSLQQSLLARPS